MSTSQSFLTRFTICNDHVRDARQQLTNLSFEGVRRELDSIVASLDSIKREHDSTVQSLEQQISNIRQNLVIERENSDNLQKELKDCEAIINSQDKTIQKRKAEIKRLEETHAKAISEKRNQHEEMLKKTKAELYQAGLAEGSWLSNIVLTGTSPLYTNILPRTFKQAIIQGDKSAVERLLPEQVLSGSPALHYAALVGNVDVARLLLTHNNVNDQCKMASEDNPGGTVYAVTPMHLAIGARNAEVIEFLRVRGGSFEVPKGPDKKKSTAPIVWLVQERWLSRNTDVDDVVRILKLVKDLGWNVNAKVNREEETMQALVMRTLKGRPEIRLAILEELKR